MIEPIFMHFKVNSKPCNSSFKLTLYFPLSSFRPHKKRARKGDFEDVYED